MGTITSRTIEYIHGNLIPLGLILGGTVFMQYHGGLFWAALAGPVTGWLAVILIDTGALWLWYRRGWWLILAVVLTALIVGAPAWQITAPLRTEMARQEAGERRDSLAVRRAVLQASILRDEIASLKENLATFRRNSERRSGWLPAIREATEALAKKRAALRDSPTKPPIRAASAPSRSWLKIATIYASANFRPLLTLLALLAIELLRVAAVFWLSRRFSFEPVQAAQDEPVQNSGATTGAISAAPPVQPRKTRASRPVQTAPVQPVQHSEKHPPPPPVQNLGAQTEPAVHDGGPANPPTRPASFSGKDEFTVRRIQQALAPLIREGGGVNAFAREHGLQKRDLVWLFKHEERAREGMPTISANKLAELAARFLAAEEVVR